MNPLLDLRSCFHPLRVCLFLALVGGAAACGSGGGGDSSGVFGEAELKENGDTFFVDPHRGGEATRLHLSEMFWGRLVDVHDVDEDGVARVQPLFRDFAINENVQSDGTNYSLETNPITQETRLVILRQRDAADTGNGTFIDLLKQAGQGLPPITPKHDDGSSSEPFSFVARNSAIVLRFDDTLDDDGQARLDLIDTVRVYTGYPPLTPFSARVIFDPNHGALVGGRFHSTRVLIDLTISQAESIDLAQPLPLNSIGLPASLTTSTEPNVSVRIPTLLDFGVGQFALLRGLSGAPLSLTENGPADDSGPTKDIVRAVRAGNPSDLNNGFLLDLNSPEVVGAWPLVVEDVQALDTEGFDFVLELLFDTSCRGAPEVSDVISIGERFVEVVQNGSPPDAGGRVADVRVRVLSGEPVTEVGVLLGNALFLSTFDPVAEVPPGCWVGFTPRPGLYPAGDVSTQAQVQVRFSEPMDPSTLDPFDTFLVVRGDANTVIISTNIVVGEVNPSSDLKEFTFLPRLELAHSPSNADPYHVRLSAVSDLAGNPLANVLQPVNFTLDADQPEVRNGGTTLRFDSTDEVVPLDLPDLRGQFFVDLEQGLIRPRPVVFSGYPADRVNPVPSIMIPYAPGVQTPLTPLGSRLHTVWRYCDLGWQVRDETKYNLDVFGLSWAPIGGRVVNDFYQEFEIRLAHSRRLPDEDIDVNLLPRFPNSGLVGDPSFFAENILNDPLSPQKVVHPRTLGYVITPADIFVASSGRPMLPYPLNRHVETPVTYTWRDTAALARAGPAGDGIPLDIEAGRPLNLENQSGYVARSGQVPSFGLPLLMEYRCYPSDEGIGLNSLDISLAINSSAIPSFRSYSTGGVNVNGQTVFRNPDLELVPAGGFNPSSSPPGRRTARSDDNSFYIGQLDAVTKVSRVHSVWINTDFVAPDYAPPVILPRGAEQPAGTSVVVEYRGATGFSLDALATSGPFDAAQLDAYGEMFFVVNDPGPPPGDEHGYYKPLGSVSFLDGVATWRGDTEALDGAQFFQMRITFVNNIQTGLSPVLSAIGVAYSDS